MIEDEITRRIVFAEGDKEAEKIVHKITAAIDKGTTVQFDGKEYLVVRSELDLSEIAIFRYELKRVSQ